MSNTLGLKGDVRLDFVGKNDAFEARIKTKLEIGWYLHVNLARENLPLFIYIYIAGYPPAI